MDTNAEFSFSVALEEMRLNNKKVARKGWNGKGMWIELQTPDENSKMTVPYLFMNVPMADATESDKGISAHTRRMPWVPSQWDMFALDWYIVE